MAMRKLTFEEAKNMSCSIPDSVIEQSVEGLRPILEKQGLIPLAYDEVALKKQLDEAFAKVDWEEFDRRANGLPADSNADKEPDETGSVLKDEG